MDNLITNNQKLNYKFLLPTKAELCQTLNANAPEYIITENNDFSYSCLKQNTSRYELLTDTEKLNRHNIFIFKRFNE